MNGRDSVAAFHAQGADDGALIGVYRFNALATSRLVRRGGTVLDLGSGSGRYLAHLAQCRPDLRIVGIELASEMVATAATFLAEAGVADRVSVRPGDMRALETLDVGRVDLVSSVYSLHHLPRFEDLACCLRGIARLRDRDGSAVWIFDHARPRLAHTAAAFADIVTPEASAEFRLDSRNSLLAAWSFPELAGALADAGLDDFDHHLARMLPLYQVHAAAPREPAPAATCRLAELPPSRVRDLAGLQRLLPGVAA